MMLELADDGAQPWPARARALSRRAATEVQFHVRREPVAAINGLRLLLLIGCVAWKMSPERILPTMLAGEAVFTAWTRRRVSPTRHDQERRADRRALADPIPPA